MAIRVYIQSDITCIRFDTREDKGNKVNPPYRPYNQSNPSQVIFRHCLISNREGLGTSPKIMGLATTDPHSHKV